MFIKIYSYHIKSDKLQDYLEIQEEADRIYSIYTDSKILHLQSKDDETKWVEIQIYKTEQFYYETIQIIDQQPEIQVLYKRFLEVIISHEEISEDNYQLIDIKGGKQDWGLR
ncbi:hypothetical protein [Mesobacillus boroniphilus]|uniref:hypothetical protein n=1 Tax=Mesobacillus boroniphilus TaxID=308892 RepID=UPI001BCDEED5|nr:hypothetical protein [Mesobacillus boroniphilus]